MVPQVARPVQLLPGSRANLTALTLIADGIPRTIINFNQPRTGDATFTTFFACYLEMDLDVQYHHRDDGKDNEGAQPHARSSATHKLILIFNN
jgi:hypothetical protein